MKLPEFKSIILFENDDYIAVNKPPFLSSLEDRHVSTNLLQMARQYFEGTTLCHRLDKETSGVIILAKHAEAYRHLSLQFEHRQVNKVYHAVADGVHTFEQVLVDAPLHTTAKGYVKIHRGKGKSSQTLFNTLEKFRYHSLIECRPTTGRMHQIRVHLKSLNASIVSDEIYDGKEIFLSRLKSKFNLAKGVEEQAMIKRVALHAYQLGFEGMRGEEIMVTADYPKDLAVLIKQLRKFS